MIHIPLFLLLGLTDTLIVNLPVLQNPFLGQQFNHRVRLCGNFLLLLLIKRLAGAVVLFAHFDSPCHHYSERKARVLYLYLTLEYHLLFPCSHNYISYNSYNSSHEKNTRVL